MADSPFGSPFGDAPKSTFKRRKTPLQVVSDSNERNRITLAGLGVDDPTKKKGPSALERIGGILDVPGAGLRSIVHNLVNPVADQDVSVLGEMGKALRGEERIEGSDILKDQGVSNKWALMGGGIALDILLDPVTYLSFGTTGAAKETAKVGAAKLLKEGVSLERAAELVPDLLTRFGDDAARLAEGASQTKELSRGLERALMTGLRKEASVALGKGQGIKLFGQTIADVQEPVEKALYKVQDLARALPGASTIEKAVNPTVDLARLGRPVTNAGQKLLDRSLAAATSRADTTAIDVGKKLMGELDEATRKVLPGAMEAAINPVRENLKAAFTTLQDALDSGADDAIEAARKSLTDLIETDLKPNYLPRLTDALMGAGLDGERLTKAMDVAEGFRSQMEDALALTEKIGVPDKSLLGAGSYGYVPHAAEPDAGFWSKLKGLVTGDLSAFEPKVSLSSPWGKTAKPRQPKGRVLDTLADWEALGLKPETDIAKLSAVKARDVARQAATAKYEDDVIKAYGTELGREVVGKEGGELLTKKAVPLEGEVVHTITRNGETIAYSIPKEAEAHFNKLSQVFTNDEATKELLGGYDKVLNTWKKMATNWNPGFHGRNAVSNYTLAWMEDLHQPYGWTTAPRVMAGKGQVELGTHGRMLAKDVLEKLSDLGVVTGDFVKNEVGESLDDALKAAKPLANLNPSVAGGKLGTAIEDTSRVAVALNALRKGMDWDAAAGMAMRTLYDYSPQSLTSFERNVGKRVVPFMIWMRRNIPHVVDVVLHTPRKLTAFTHAKEVADAVNPVDESVMPEYLRDLFPIPLPLKDKAGNSLMVNPNLPFQDIEKLNLLRDGKLDLKDLLSSVSPVIKTPLELAVNRDFYFGSDISNYPGDSRRAPGYVEEFDDVVHGVKSLAPIAQAWDTFKDAFGIVEKESDGEAYLAMNAYALKALRDLSPWMNNVGKVATYLGSDQDSADAYKALAAASGVKLTPFQTEKFAKSQLYEDQDKLQGAIARLKAEGKTKPKSKFKSIGIAQLGGGGRASDR